MWVSDTISWSRAGIIVLFESEQIKFMNSLFHVTIYNLQHCPRQLNVRNAEESGRRQARHQCRDDAIVYA